MYEDRQTLPELRWFWSITVYVDPNHSPALRQSRFLRLNHLTSAGLQVVVVVDVVASGGLEETGASADIGAAGFVRCAAVKAFGFNLSPLAVRLPLWVE
jgi:hypothetical protein